MSTNFIATSAFKTFTNPFVEDREFDLLSLSFFDITPFAKYFGRLLVIERSRER